MSRSSVAALQARGSTIVEVELMRLEQRLPSATVSLRAEALRVLDRIADRLLQHPAIRTSAPAGRRRGSYAAALADLYELDTSSRGIVRAQSTFCAIAIGD
ncbi:MAG TPA: hypothetical protein PK324_21280 [Nocardioides sp.]|uniref:hypothetical protein n=1 Tax=uncultured Nocardioides sp. TaxID=198441 RepID=UPI00261333FA|nr:hypothetical protein [uncultured Nocardioides sp.]HRD61878.1 hypothetical protein [Nocardioides sp.]HRK48181.1 hypothetical protein [Nocardioides sp.]